MFRNNKIINSFKAFVDFWFVLKLMLILMCAGAFYWNSAEIINRYMQYSTIVMVEYKQPNKTQLPAVTLCAYTFISDDVLASEYWDEWYSPSNTTKFERYAIRQKVRAKALKDKTVVQIFNDSITFESMVARCFFYPNSKQSRSNTLQSNYISR